ncbi:MAG: flagellar basal body-associated FliL family protein [Chloroflexota bacterium]|nr:MAG: flagellar basal body-associated FliL family protein [Chloroflexota bacterium]
MGGLIAKITGNKIVLGGVIGGLIGLVAIVLFVVMGVGGASVPTEAAAPGKGSATKTLKPAADKATSDLRKFGPTYVMKDKIVNLADPGGRRYLRFTVAIEFEAHTEEKASAPLANDLVSFEPGRDRPLQPVTGGASKDPDKDFLAAIKKYIPAIEDAVTTVLSSKTYADLASAEGKDQAKKEIKDRVQRLLGDSEHVTNVYFTEFVVQ